jgi:hypothetical protein
MLLGSLTIAASENLARGSKPNSRFPDPAEENRNYWTPERMRRAPPMPMPRVDLGKGFRKEP